MKVHSGKSSEKDSAKAVASICASWPDRKPNFILVFHSTEQDPNQAARAIAEHFPGVPFAGCTSSGEHLNGEHLRGNLVMTGIWSDEIQWSVAVIDNISSINEKQAMSAATSLMQNLGLDRENLSPDQQFCITFIDGLSMKEEQVSAYLAEALDGIPLIGGSAGDDLKFEKTYVLANGKAHQNAAVLVMADSKLPFHVLKHQHFIKTPQQLVVTKVDTAARRVYELDGFPALHAYAHSLGVKPEEVSPELCFVNPLLFRVNNEFYVRSIQKIEDDGSLVFYCGVEEGMVLEVGGHEKIEAALSRDVESAKHSYQGQGELVIACNCILRALEAEQDQKHESLGRIISSLGKNIIGFDTYGEQLNGLHINQTLVGLVLGRAA